MGRCLRVVGSACSGRVFPASLHGRPLAERGASVPVQPIDVQVWLLRSAEAYRRAVDLSPRDYRAWYGLGQTYELLHMPFYALHYFRRATQVGLP